MSIQTGSQSFSPPKIITEPADFSAYVGGKILLSVKVEAVPEPEYQWFLNGEKIAGANEKKLVIKGAQAEHEGHYSCQVKNKVGIVMSKKAFVRTFATRIAELKIGLAAMKAEAGKPLRIAVQNENFHKDFSVDWFFNGKRIKGANGAALEIPNLAPAHEGEYKAVLVVGTEMQSSNVLTVKIAPIAAAESEEEEDFFFSPKAKAKAAPKAPSPAPTVLTLSANPRKTLLLKKKAYLEKMLAKIEAMRAGRAGHAKQAA